MTGLLLALGLLTGVPGQVPAPAQGSPYGKTVTAIRVPALSPVDEARVVAELASRVGEPYLEPNVRQDRARLDRLGMFGAVEIRPVVSGDTVALEIDVEQVLTYLPMVSFDFSDEDGVSGGPGLKSVNFLNRGIFLSAAARFGGATQVEVLAEDRWISRDPFYQVQFFYRDRRNTLDGFDEQSIDLDLRIGRHVTPQITVGGQLTLLSMGAGSDGITFDTDRRDTVAAVGVFVGQDTLDSRANPHHGWLNELAVSRQMGSGTGSWKLIADIRRYQPVGDRHTLALFSLTTLQSGHIGTDLPVYMDFHLGGTNTVRGWDLGAIRGKNQQLATVEYRYTLLDPGDFSLFGGSFYLGVQAAVFGDLGVAWDDGDAIGGAATIDGYGVGFRLLVPFVDVVRLDFAFGQPGTGWGRYGGVLEKAAMQRRRVR